MIATRQKVLVLIGILVLVILGISLGMRGGVSHETDEATAISTTTSVVADVAGMSDKPKELKTYAQLMARWFEGDGCTIATKTLVLPHTDGKTPKLSFDYVSCGPAWGNYRVTSDEIRSVQEPRPGNPSNVQEDRAIARYEIVDSALSTEEVLRQSVFSTFNEEQKQHCSLVTSSFRNIFLGYGAKPTQDLQTYTYEPDAFLTDKYQETVSTACGLGGVRFYVRLQDVLLDIYFGQDMPLFDPSSFRIRA
ncbi:MAG: hypothetical protein V4480_02520 [Patescibacteria group bacterium]